MSSSISASQPCTPPPPDPLSTARAARKRPAAELDASATTSAAELDEAARTLAVMRSAQLTGRPSARPRCLHDAPAGMLQISDREALVCYISEVCEDFGLRTRIAGLAVIYFDRYVGGRQAPLDFARAQLLALASLLVAAKFSEFKMPGLDDLCHESSMVPFVGAHRRRGMQTDQSERPAVTREALTTMELDLLLVLRWELHCVTPYAALEPIAALLGSLPRVARPEQQGALLEDVEFFVHISFYEHKLLAFAPLTVACSAFVCAWGRLGLRATARHRQRLCEASGASELELVRCTSMLQGYFASRYPAEAPSTAPPPPGSAGGGQQSLPPWRIRHPPAVQWNIRSGAVAPSPPYEYAWDEGDAADERQSVKEWVETIIERGGPEEWVDSVIERGGHSSAPAPATR